MYKLLDGNAKKKAVASLSKGGDDEQTDSVSGIYSAAQLITQLKVLALDPCRSQFAKDNFQPLCDQILSLREAMTVKGFKTPSRKRKLEQFVKDKLSRKQLSNASSGLVNSVHSTQAQVESRTSTSLLTFDGTFSEKQPCTKVSYPDYMGRSASTPIEIDGSEDGSNPVTPERVAPNEVPPIVSNNTKLSKLDGAHMQSHSVRLPKFIEDCAERRVIPVGPRFQASLPEWTGPVTRNVYTSSDTGNSKWLGSRMWPIINGNKKTTSSRKNIGRGRPDSCSCVSPQSTDCVRKHIHEKTVLLQRELGPVFFNWKFDEMGEQVSSWTLKEQQTFESVVKARPSDEGKSFLKRALKRFPKKDRKDIVNYYFGVYIPKRIIMQRSLPYGRQVNTDDEDDGEEEEVEIFGNTAWQKKFKEKDTVICKGVKG